MVAAVGLSLAGCGSLDHHQLGPGQFNVWGDGIYAHETYLEREATSVCPTGFAKLAVYDGPESADVARIIRWRIACKGISR